MNKSLTRISSILFLAVFISATFLSYGNWAKADEISANPVPVITLISQEYKDSSKPNSILNILANNFLVALINSIFPQSVPKGSKSITIIVNGDSFMPNQDSTDSGSIIYINGKPLKTKYNSSRQLVAEIDDSYLSDVQTYEIKVVNPAPGGGISNTVNFSISSANPNPIVSDIIPLLISLGNEDFMLTINGYNFIPNSSDIPNSGSIIYFNNTPVTPTTYISSNQLTAKVPALYRSKEGVYNVMVVNPYPGGGPSNPLTFSVANTSTSITIDTSTPALMPTPTPEPTPTPTPMPIPAPTPKPTPIPTPTPKHAISCKPNWQCTEWSSCNNFQQTRSCRDANSCEISTGKPITTQPCITPTLIAVPLISKPEIPTTPTPLILPITVLPHIDSIKPDSGKAGTEITITGTNFDSKNNYVNFGKGSTRSSYQGFGSKDNKTIKFSMPTYNIPLCAYNKFPCRFAYIEIKPGAYNISITNSSGISNTIKFIISSK